MKKLLASVVILVLASTNTRATALLAIRTPDRVTIGADQMTRDVGANGAPDKVYFARKIRPVGEYWFAVAGLNSAPSGFDVDVIIRDAFKGPGSLAEKVARFESAVQTPLASALLWLRLCEPKSFARMELQTNSTPLSVVFAGIEGGKPVVLGFEATITNAEAMALSGSIDTLADGAVAGKAAIFRAGQWRAIEDSIAANGQAVVQALASGDMATITRAIIQDVSARKPQSVGGPVDVLELSASGARWR